MFNIEKNKFLKKIEINMIHIKNSLYAYISLT